jgi:hypothetical protein
MKTENIIGGIAGLVLVTLIGTIFFMIGRDAYLDRFFSYKKNSCIARFPDRTQLESWEPKKPGHGYEYIYQILEVGKRNYLTYQFKEGTDGQLTSAYYDYDINVSTQDKGWLNRDYFQIDCNTLEPIK